jgi:hypothetical protein
VSEVRIDPVYPRRLVRIGGVFPVGLYNLFVTYTAAENRPAIAIEAVKEAAALLWRLRGKEHISSESLGDLGSQTLTEIDRRLWALPMWRAAVEQLRKPTLVLA